MGAIRKGRGIFVIVLVAIGLGVAVEIGRAVLNPMGLLLSPGKKEPDFSGTTLGGERWALSDHLGRRPVLLNFFATWCGPCKMEYPELMDLAERYGPKKHGERGLQIVFLTEEPRDVVTQDADMKACPLPVLVDAAPVFEAFRVSQLPRTIYYDAQGKRAADILGYDPERLARLRKDVEASTAGGHQREGLR